MNCFEILFLMWVALLVVASQFWLRSNRWMYRASIVPAVVRSLQFIVLMLIGAAMWQSINGR